jgi:hypothetical protein
LIENILIGIVLVIIGSLGFIDGISSRLRKKDDFSGSNMQYLSGSSGLFLIGIYLIIKYFYE